MIEDHDAPRRTRKEDGWVEGSVRKWNYFQRKKEDNVLDGPGRLSHVEAVGFAWTCAK